MLLGLANSALAEPVDSSGEAISRVLGVDTEPERRVSRNSWAVVLGREEEDLQEIAELSDKQKEEVQSLVSNMLR